MNDGNCVTLPQLPFGHVTLYYSFADPRCHIALGMRSGRIHDKQISASSWLNNQHAAKFGRLYMKKRGSTNVGAWVARVNNGYQWFKVGSIDWLLYSAF